MKELVSQHYDLFNRDTYNLLMCIGVYKYKKRYEINSSSK